MCSHYLYIYQVPSQWQPFLIHPIRFLGATAILSPVLCQLHCRHPQQQPVAVVVIYILRTFALMLSIVTLVCAMFADTMDSFNVCEMAACHDLHSAPDPPDTLVDGITFYATSSNSFGIYYAWPATHSYLFSTVCRKKNATCSLQNIYFSYFCLLIIS